jgi:hypothetical protein
MYALVCQQHGSYQLPDTTVIVTTAWGKSRKRRFPHAIVTILWLRATSREKQLHFAVSSRRVSGKAPSGWGFSLVQRYDSTLPDWQKRSDDRHFIGTSNGDGKADPLIDHDQD